MNSFESNTRHLSPNKSRKGRMMGCVLLSRSVVLVIWGIVVWGHLFFVLRIPPVWGQRRGMETTQADSLKEVWRSKMQLQLMEAVALEGLIDPEEYVLGPGDEVVVNIWGDIITGEDLPIPPRIPITPEGKALIPTIGDLSVGNMSLAEAAKVITREIKKKYRNVSVTVNLSKLRQFRVFVLGEIAIPGTYVGRAIDRVSALIDRAGGFTPKSSMRRIEVRRRTGDTLSADLVLFNRTGQLDLNPYVLEGDVVFVPVKLDSVNISGAVNIPGDYEFKKDDTLRDFIDIAGGLTSQVNMAMAEIVRFEQDGKSTRHFAVDLDTLVGPDGTERHFILEKDDRIFIRAKTGWRIRRTVTVEGEVRYPGDYAIEKDKTTLSRLIEMTGGFTPDAYLNQASVIRRIYTEIVDPEFERLRRMLIADMTEEEREYFKTKSREHRGVVVVNFDKLFNGQDLSQDIVLKDRDIVRIPKVRTTVTVSGAVENPGSVIYEPEMNIDYYIEQAGGYTLDARKSKVRLIKGETGVWLRPDEVREIRPGDSVWIPEKPDRDWWSLFKDFMLVTAQIATIAIVIKQIAY